MKKSIRFLMAAGALVLMIGISGCGPAPGEGESSAKESDRATSSEKQTDQKDKDKSTEEEKKQDEGIVLDKKGYLGSYTFLYPSTDRTNPAVWGDYIGITGGFQIILASADEATSIDTSSVDMFIESSMDRIKRDIGEMRPDTYGKHFDNKTYINVDSTEKADVEGWDAYIVRGEVGDENYDLNMYFVACYVLSDNEPFYLFGVPWRDNPGTAEALEAYLKQLLGTFEYREF